VCEDGSAALRTGFWTSVLGLFAGSNTLICRAPPALLAAIGARAALSALISVFPQVVWLSERKVEVLSFAGAALNHGEIEPCPVGRTRASPATRPIH